MKDGTTVGWNWFFASPGKTFSGDSLHGIGKMIPTIDDPGEIIAV